MAAKHTAGEWHAKDGQIYPIETGKTLATIPYFDKDNEEQEANQKLIAAAPDLLDALNELDQLVFSLNINVDGITALALQSCRNRVTAAIQKATT